MCCCCPPISSMRHRFTGAEFKGRFSLLRYISSKSCRIITQLKLPEYHSLVFSCCCMYARLQDGIHSFQQKLHISKTVSIFLAISLYAFVVFVLRRHNMLIWLLVALKFQIVKMKMPYSFFWERRRKIQMNDEKSNKHDFVQYRKEVMTSWLLHGCHGGGRGWLGNQISVGLLG